MLESNTPKRRLLLLLLAVLGLCAAACGGSDSATPDGSDTTAQVEREGADADAEGDVEVGGELDAMGEDDPDGSIEPTTTTTAGGSTDTSAEERPSTTTTAVDVPDGVEPGAGAELAAAVEAAADQRFASPYIYVTADQTCDGCAERVGLYYAPKDGDFIRHALRAAFVDGVEVSFDMVDPSLVQHDPLYIAEVLLDELASGAEVTYRIDGLSGLATTWSIGGDEVALRCFQVDMAPIDLRDAECYGSLIG